MKKCIVCKNDKEFISFCKNKRKIDGYNVMCKECTKIQSEKYYKNNKDSINQKAKVWYNNNREKHIKRTW